MPGAASEEDVAWVFHPDRQAWADQGFDRDTAHQWLDIGVTDPAAAFRWANHFTPPEAAQWAAAGFDAQAAQAWKTRFNDPKTAAGWDNAGWWDIAAALLWHSGYSPQSATDAWAAEGFTPDEASFWVVDQFSAEDARRCVENGWTNTTAAHARRSGLDPRQNTAPEPSDNDDGGMA